MTSDVLPPPTNSRRAALALIAAMIALAGVHISFSWRAADNVAESMVQALARTLEYQTDTTLRSIDTLLLEAVDRIDPAQPPNPSQLQWLQARLGSFPEARNLLVIGPDGKTVGVGLSSTGVIGPSLDVSDRQHFRFHRDHPGSKTLVIGDPIVDRLDGRQIIPLSRALVDGQGRFKGMIAIGLDPAYMVKALESLMIEEAGGISVIREDGIFLARLPDQYGSFGRSVASSPLFRQYLTNSPSGIARFVSVADGNAKIVAYRTLERYPVVVTVGITENTAYASFWTETVWIVICVLVLAGALYRLAMLSDLREYSRATLAARLERQSEALEQEVKDRTRHLEEATAESEKRARQLAISNADLEHFAHVASHDLQEPLRTVISFVQLLEQRHKDSPDPESRDYIHFVVDGAKRMKALIEDLLSYSSISRLGETLTAYDLSQMAFKAMGNLEPAITETKAAITVGFLPVLNCDRAQMTSLFQNLIGNAIKFRKPGTAPVIDISAKMEGNEWVFRVHDDGIGLDPRYKDRIFVLFQRLHGSDAYEGTGIGLAICKRIIDRHQGRIWVESEPGKGATFVFTLPVKKAA